MTVKFICLLRNKYAQQYWQLYHFNCHEFIVILGFSISDWKKDVNWEAIDPDGPDDDEEDFAREDARPAG